MAGWLALDMSTSLFYYPVEIPAHLCSGMPNYWATEAHDLWGFLQPYVTKTKAVVAWNQKEAEETLKSDVYFYYFDCGEGLWAYA